MIAQETLHRLVHRSKICRRDTVQIENKDKYCSPFLTQESPAVISQQMRSFRVREQDWLPLCSGIHNVEKGNLLHYKNKRTGEIDWSKTKAYHFQESYIHVNLKGKYLNGIVEKFDLETVKDEIIRLLEEVKDEETGEHLVQIAAKKEDMNLLGFYGDRVGEVIFFLKPWNRKKLMNHIKGNSVDPSGTGAEGAKAR